MPSTKPCNRPNLPTRLGPRRICIRATIRRSPHTAMIVKTTQAAKIIKLFRAMIQPGSWAINSALLMLCPPSQESYQPYQVL